MNDDDEDHCSIVQGFIYRW